MPESITFTQNLGNASFDIDPAVLQQRAEAAAQAAAEAESEEGDSVEITITEIPSESTDDSPTSGSSPGIYGPETFDDKFRYAIENGMLDPSRRFNPLRIRFQTSATETYEARGSLGAQVMQNAGLGTSLALFNIQYQDAQPNPNDISSNVDAKVEQQRIADQNLHLLNTL
ncbi:MAG: hypothetical protein O7G87_02810 [bacterium]|nr:hypothetical protein [bacterium]